MLSVGDREIPYASAGGRSIYACGLQTSLYGSRSV